MTARERAIRALQEAGAEGLSKAQLKEKVGGNAGAFRRLLMSMEGKGEVLIEEVDNPQWGPTKIHRVGPGVNAPA